MTDQDRPLLRVVKGEPTAEELAALVAVVAARRANPTGPATQTPRSAWAAPKWRLRRPLSTGPGAWRSSGRTF